MEPTTSREKTWETYVKSWYEISDEERSALFETALSPTCVYEDPLAKTKSWDELRGYMTEFHKQIPGGHFVTKSFRALGDKSVACWDLCDKSGNVIGDGISYGEYGDDGKLIRMVGFFEAPA